MELTDAIIKEWKAQAEADGLLKDYTYHLGMIYPPIPYQMWKLKFEALNRIQARQDFKDGLDLPMGMEKRHNELCRELGY